MTETNSYGPPTENKPAVPSSPEEIARIKALTTPVKPPKAEEKKYPSAVKVIHQFPFSSPRGFFNYYQKDQIFTDAILIKELIDNGAPVTGLLDREYLVCEKCHHVQSKK